MNDQPEPTHPGQPRPQNPPPADNPGELNGPEHPANSTNRSPDCPTCGAPGAPLVLGRPTAEAIEAADAGDLALGWCLTPDQPPNWQCPQKHRWADPDENAWDRQVLAALTAHGYNEQDDQPLIEPPSIEAAEILILQTAQAARNATERLLLSPLPED